jgi:SAM-dependent methyltransferase
MQMREPPAFIGHTLVMTRIWYGAGVADDSDLRLTGDVTGKRVIELGIAPTPSRLQPNSVLLALAGAKAIALDPDADRIAEVRRRASEAEVRVECHEGDLADLGFATSASVDLVIASRTFDQVDDLPRVLRQVHRVLRPEAAFVVALTHPVAAMFDGPGQPVHRYGSTVRSFGELFMSLERANFRIDMVHELMPDDTAMVPAVLVFRARKQGV